MLSAYIAAGYTPICGSRLDTALEYVQHQLEMPSRLKGEVIEVQIVPVEDGWTPSGYYWESDTLFKRSI